jgi:hypothetical protein
VKFVLFLAFLAELPAHQVEDYGYLSRFGWVHLSGVGQISVFIRSFFFFVILLDTFVFAALYQIDNVILGQKEEPCFYAGITV